MSGVFLRLTKAADIKSLTAADDPTLVERAGAAFQKHNEEQLVTVKLPGSGKNVGVFYLYLKIYLPRLSIYPREVYFSKKVERKGKCSNSHISREQVLISSYNSLGDGRYVDVESGCSFVFDHVTQVGVHIMGLKIKGKHVWRRRR